MSPPITLQMASSAGPEHAREITMGLESIIHSQTVRGVGVGFEEPHLRLMV